MVSSLDAPVQIRLVGNGIVFLDPEKMEDLNMIKLKKKSLH